MVQHLIGELFQTRADDDEADSVYDSPPDRESREAKMRDAARMITEAAGALKLAHAHPDLSMLFLHGPLVNPVAPYASIPNLTNRSIAELTGVASNGTGPDHHFILVYKGILEALHDTNVPVAGIIERSGSRSLITQIVRDPSSRVSDAEKLDIENTLREYGINDSTLFEFILEPGQYIEPVRIDKNLRAKAPAEWMPIIEGYHQPSTTVLKSAQMSTPFRVEMWNDQDPESCDRLLRLSYHNARLLPNYAFPVGLDIVDKYAKFPNWLSAQMSRELSAIVLRRAIETGNPETVRRVRMLLATPRRDWLFRPPAG